MIETIKNSTVATSANSAKIVASNDATSNKPALQIPVSQLAFLGGVSMSFGTGVSISA